MDPTTNPALKSFIPVGPEDPFPIQNLPYGVFRPHAFAAPRVGVAIGAYVLDLPGMARAGLLALPGPDGTGTQDASDPRRAEDLFSRSSLNAFMALGRPAWRAVRAQLSALLSASEPRLRDDAALRAAVLHPMAEVELLLPVEIGDYTDFYSSREHATNVGTMFRGPENALLPNWLHVPIGYHGRASSVVISGTDLHRPMGQTKPPEADAPVFGPSKQLDFELEVGYFVGPGNPLGQPIPIDQAPEHLFGLVLLNDWSARDIQTWEYQPLGPFLAKNFGTSISPWVVTLEALEPFRCAGPRQDPVPLPYLQGSGDWAIDLQLEVSLQTVRMAAPFTICHTNFRHMYWSLTQQVAHHTVNGCNLRTGDLLASGTISGPDPGERGSLLELSWRGREPLALPGGETRSFLEDGDRLTMTGWCQGDGYRVGFGEVTGRVLPAVDAQLE